MKYSVQVIEKSTDEVIDTIGEPTVSYDDAERLAKAARINLNHQEFRVKIATVSE